MVASKLLRVQAIWPKFMVTDHVSVFDLFAKQMIINKCFSLSNLNYS